MSDPSHPATAHPLSDEELSAVIDGEADDAVLDRLGRDEQAQARLQELREASHLIGASVIEPPSAEIVDRLVDRALEAANAPDAPIAPLGSSSGRAATGPPRLLVAAVVVVLAAIGLGLVWSGTRVDRDDAAVTSSATDEDDRAAEAGEDPRKMALSDIEPVDLGIHPDIPSLRASIRSGIPSARAADLEPVPASERPSSDEMSRCAIQMWELWQGENLRQLPDHTGYASVDGDIVLVYEFGVTDGDHRALVSITTPDDCDPQNTFVLD